MPSYRHPVAWAVGLLIVGLVVTACGSSTSPVSSGPAGTPVPLSELPKNADGYTDISVEQLAAALENKDFTLVNVHIPYEGELEQTDLFIPYDDIDAHLEQLPAKDAPIVLYCRSGSMSTTAAQDLVEQGYTNVYELDGGFNSWKARGYELLNKKQ